jgi:hypothetical protein
MKVVVEIPECALVAWPPADVLARELLEAYAIHRYRQGSLTQKQVGALPGLDRWSTEALLQRQLMRFFLDFVGTSTQWASSTQSDMSIFKFASSFAPALLFQMGSPQLRRSLPLGRKCHANKNGAHSVPSIQCLYPFIPQTSR